MANKYTLGDEVRITGTFKDGAGAVQDPTDVYCKYSDPSGNVITLHYGVDGELLKDSVGVYHVDVDADEAGTWEYRFYSTGAGQAAGESLFKVNQSAFS